MKKVNNNHWLVVGEGANGLLASHLRVADATATPQNEASHGLCFCDGSERHQRQKASKTGTLLEGTDGEVCFDEPSEEAFSPKAGQAKLRPRHHADVMSRERTSPVFVV